VTLTVGSTVEELITDNIVSTIAAIDGVGWNTTIPAGNVTEMDVDPLDQPTFPMVAVFHGGTPTTHLPLGEQKSAIYWVVLALEAGSATPRTDINRFIADVETALHQTFNRGGNARDTLVDHSEIQTRTLEDPIIQATLKVRVTFAHPFGDPTTPK